MLPALLPSPVTPNFASAMRMKIESAVVSEGDNPGVQDEGKSLDATQDSSGLGNCIVVQDEDEIPSCILNGTLLQNVRWKLLVRRCLLFRCTCVTLIGIFRRRRRLNVSSNED